jgi:putative oxidoreductase
MLETFFAPYSDWGLLILRVGIALVFFSHGLPKLNPNSEMKGIQGVAGFFQQLNIPFPKLSAWIVALLETVGAIALALGLGTHLLGAAYAFDMFVAIVKAKIGMMRAPFSGQNGWDFEFALLIAGLALVFTGSGAVSLDYLFGI